MSSNPRPQAVVSAEMAAWIADLFLQGKPQAARETLAIYKSQLSKREYVEIMRQIQSEKEIRERWNNG